MTYIVIFLIIIIVTGIVLLDRLEVLGTLAITFALIGCLIMAPLSFEWVAAGYEARIINDEYGTDYTRAEVFYASSVIDTIRELQRDRIEVNGDLVRGN